jgi:hypothetical protein
MVELQPATVKHKLQNMSQTAHLLSCEPPPAVFAIFD